MTVKNKSQIKVVALCAIVATTFWFFNAMNNQYTTNVSFPIKHQITSPNLKLISNVPSKIEVNVYGSGWDILKVSLGIGYDPYRIKINSEKKQQFHSTNLMPYISHQLTKLKVNFIHKEAWNTVVDSIISKKIILNTDFINTPKNSILLNQTNITPNTLTITGPRTYINKIPDNFIIPIKASKIGIQNTKVEIEPFLNKNIACNINSVKIQYTFDEIIEEATTIYSPDSTQRFFINYTKPKTASAPNQDDLYDLIQETKINNLSLINYTKDSL